MKAIAKYLQHYAEPEAQWLSSFSFQFLQCLSVPMYKESIENCQYFLDFASKHAATLLILVLNRPREDEDKLWAKQILEELDTPHWSSDNQLLHFHTLNNNSGLLVVDRCIDGEPIPQDQGVGLARKIANDIGCQLIANQRIQSHWLYNTDADARLPSNYFSIIQNIEQNVAAYLFPYRHISDGDQAISIATQLYELSLNYYVAALYWAGSPYAYQTLGSIMVLNYRHYSQVRGFPKRAGAEDFYLLNKLAKTADIVSLEHPSIKLISRQSSRVPFGTGPAVKKIIETGNYGGMPFYHPYLFHYLKAILTLLKQLAEHNNLAAALAKITDPLIDKHLLGLALAHFEIESALNHAYRQGRTIEQRLKQLNTWFDGFKTLKFLHFIRDHNYPMLPYNAWQLAIINEPYAENLAILIPHDLGV